jgi:hypothetical protein
MALPARKASATGRHEAATAALAETQAQLTDLTARRDKALLADDVAGAVKLGVEIEDVRRLADAHRQRLVLLAEEVQKEANERRVQAQAELIGRIEKKFTERTKVGEELAAVITQANRLFRKLLELNHDLTAPWAWPTGDLASIMLPRQSILSAIEHELYRQTAVPMLGGGMDRGDTGTRFPGAKAPSFTLMGQPQSIVPLVDALKAAAAHASDIMRGKRALTSAPVTINGAPRTPAEAKLDDLLKRQGQLASLKAPTPEEERAYSEIVAQISLAQAEVQKQEASHG